MTGYNGNTITYTTNGNPLNDDTWKYTWRHGRQLETMTAIDGSAVWTYTYDKDGLRLSRSDGTTTYNYVYLGSQLKRMTVGNTEIYFAYDSDGSPMSMVYNGITYYYVKNLQGDVVGIVDKTGVQVVAYSYDAWGNLLGISGAKASTIGAKNPLRYRGYVYDTETGLYYLQSRYYNPATGRFLNADGYVSTGQGLLGNNMFAYCENNPVNRYDPSGCLWEIVVAGIVCAILLTGCSGGEVGAAPDYIHFSESDGDRSKNPNCYSYAVGYYDQSYDPGDLSRTSYTMDVDSVAQAVIEDMTEMGRTARIIDDYDSPISENEYRIALRTSDVYQIPTPTGVLIGWDYHFMVQTSDGNWAEKHGPGGASVYHKSGNPNTISWDLGTMTGFYTSDIIYFAISKGES